MISRAVDILAQARRIEFYGLGASGPVAKDAHHKFFRLNMPVVAYTDILVQRMAAAGTHPGDAVVVISLSGRTLPLIETARVAREAGRYRCRYHEPRLTFDRALLYCSAD